MNVFIFGDGDAFTKRLDVIEKAVVTCAQHLHLIHERLDAMAISIDDLLAKSQAALDQIKTNTDLDQSIIAICNRNATQIADLKAQLEAAGTDAAKLDQVAANMDALIQNAKDEGQAVADAVTANTPADPPAPADGGTLMS